MPTSFLTNLDTSVKPYISGTKSGSKTTRYCLTNSRNANRKVIRLAATASAQLLGINAPTVAPTGSGGTGTNIYYRYVYINKFFIDPLALEATDPFIRSNASPVSAAVASGTTPATILGTVSTDPQVTHVWLYMCATATGVFVRQLANYEVTNTGTPTWTSEIAVPTASYGLEIDNAVPDTARINENINSFFLLGGFVPLSTTGTTTIGANHITGTAFPDGIIALNAQFAGDTTGGPDGNGIFLVKWTNSTTLGFINTDGSVGTYNGPTNKTGATLRIWRSDNVIEISKRFNMDATPSFVDPNYLITGPGTLTAIAKPQNGFTVKLHWNNNGFKSVDVADFTQGVPARIYTTSSVYAACNPRAWCSAGGRNFYYDFAAGIIEDRLTQHMPLTQNVIPNLMRSLGGNSATISEMEFDPSRSLIFLSVCPSGYNKAYYLIVYSLVSNTWNLWFMLPDISAMRRIEDPTTGAVTIKMGSSNGSYTVWPSANFNEAVGSSIYGVCASIDDSTHLTAVGTPFPTAGDKLTDRWIMTWNDQDEVPVYQFARISTNTSSRLTLDTFIGPNSTAGFAPVPGIGDSYWCGPIQSILGPNWQYNATPDEDGKIHDIAMVSSGLDIGQQSKVALYRNFETSPVFGGPMQHNTYVDQSLDPDHQSIKAGPNDMVEATGVTGWQLIDNNEAPLSIKSVVRRVQALSAKLNRK